jgi:hypothetical protein
MAVPCGSAPVYCLYHLVEPSVIAHVEVHCKPGKVQILVAADLFIGRRRKFYLPLGEDIPEILFSLPNAEFEVFLFNLRTVRPET